MKNRLTAFLLVLQLLGLAEAALAQGTAFTYQGRLDANGAPANGFFDLQLIIYDNSVGGNQQGPILTNTATVVSNGVFTITMDFGAVFTGASRWLEISVRTNGIGGFTGLSPRQSILPTPYVIYSASAGTATTSGSATTATTATRATSFTGSLAGDVTGTQAATVVSTVGGQTAANVAGGAVLANAATSANTAGAIVRRDGTGGFTGAIVNATTFNGSFTGNGNNLTSLSAGSIAAGTLADARLSANVPLLNRNQTFSGANTFANLIFSTAAGTLSFINDGGLVPGLVANSAVASGHMRFHNALEIWPNIGQNAAGYLDVRDTNQNAQISLDGSSGTITANTLSGNASGLGLNSGFFLNDNPMYLRNDQNHGLAYNGFGITNFPSSSVQPDGPVLWGYTGGALAVLNGGPQAMLSWDNAGVDVSASLSVSGGAEVLTDLDVGEDMGVRGNLAVGADLAVGGNIAAVGNLSVTGNISGYNTPGVNQAQFTDEPGGATDIFIKGGTTAGWSCGNAIPAPGFFVLTASFNGYSYGSSGSTLFISLVDVTSSSSPNTLTTQVLDALDGFNHSATLSWVVPTGPTGTFQNFALEAYSPDTSWGVAAYNLTVMYFPRNNAQFP